MQPLFSKKLNAGFAPYAKGVRSGNLIFYSGQVALDIKGNLVAGGIKAETATILSHIEQLLSEVALSKANIVKINVYIAQMNAENFAAFNQVYTEWVAEYRPARTTIGVFSLPKNGNIEMEFIAEEGV